MDASRLALALVAVMFTACGGRDGGQDGEEGIASISVGSEGDSGSADNSGPMKFDVGEGDRSDGNAEATEEGCDKVDFVFVMKERSARACSTNRG
jgi:hypothetical protein